MSWRRSIGSRDYLHINTSTRTVGQVATIPMPLCGMWRLVATAVGEGATLRYRGVKEGADGIADATDTGALDAAYSDILSSTVLDTGWIDAQPSAIRIEAVGGTVTVKIMWTSRLLPAIA